MWGPPGELMALGGMSYLSLPTLTGGAQASGPHFPGTPIPEKAVTAMRSQVQPHPSQSLLIAQLLKEFLASPGALNKMGRLGEEGDRQAAGPVASKPGTVCLRGLSL